MILIRHCIRRFWKHVLFGAAVGVGSYELWQYALPAGASQWLLCAVAVGFVLAVEFTVQAIRDRRTRPARTRRRAHARPRPDTRKDTTTA